jgi:hypothetical protein
MVTNAYIRIGYLYQFYYENSNEIVIQNIYLKGLNRMP